MGAYSSFAKVRATIQEPKDARPLGNAPSRNSLRDWNGTLARYANCDGVFVLVCSGSLEADGVKKLIEIVYNLLIEPIQLSSFVVLEFGVSPVRLEQPGSER